MFLCPVCLSVARVPPVANAVRRYDCPVCGTYRILPAALAVLQPWLDQVDCTRLSASIRERAERMAPDIPLLNVDLVHRFIAAALR